MSISNASFRLPVEQNTEGYQFFARGSRVIFEPNKTTPNPTRALVENDGGVPTVTGVCARLASCTRGVGGAAARDHPADRLDNFTAKHDETFGPLDDSLKENKSFL